MKKGELKMFSTSRKMIVAGILTLSVLGAGASAALAEEAAPSADAAVSFLSKYVWRGYELSDDSIVIQPSLSVSYMGFGINLWGNLDTNWYDEVTDDEITKWIETDLTLSYDGSVEKLGYGVGYIYYAINAESESDSQEIYATLSYDTILAPSFAVYYDIDAFDGDTYFSLGIGHSFALSEAMSLDLGFSAGYYIIDSDDEGYSAFHDGVLSASISFPVGEYVTIAPELYYSFPLSDDAQDFYEATGDEDGYVYGGATVSFAF
jgi:uncharacterized protein (TIGR02001 family)